MSDKSVIYQTLLLSGNFNIYCDFTRSAVLVTPLSGMTLVSVVNPGSIW